MAKNTPTVGKIRGLASTSNQAGSFTILALDHRQSFLKMIDPTHAESVEFNTVVEVKSQVVRLLGAHASAVLLDPIYGAGQAVANGALPGSLGLIVAVEESGYTGSEVARQSALLPDWSVKKIKRMGADAVKLLIYYHPDTGELAESQESFVKAVVQDCLEADLPLFLEAVSYSPVPGVSKSSVEFAEHLPELTCEIARRLGALQPDVLKLEFPVHPIFQTDQGDWHRACQNVSRAAPCPWALLSGGVDFELFARQVEVACQAGASGYIAGRAVWQEAIALPTPQREAWLSEVGARRLDRLNDIALRWAIPWKSFFPNLAESVGENWYRSYPEQYS